MVSQCLETSLSQFKKCNNLRIVLFVSEVGQRGNTNVQKENTNTLQPVNLPWLHTFLRVNREKLVCNFLIKLKQRIFCHIFYLEGNGCPRVVEVKIKILLFRVKVESCKL